MKNPKQKKTQGALILNSLFFLASFNFLPLFSAHPSPNESNFWRSKKKMPGILLKGYPYGRNHQSVPISFCCLLPKKTPQTSTPPKQKHQKTHTRWFKVTFSSPSWRSLNHWKGSLNHPKKVTLNHLAPVFHQCFCRTPMCSTHVKIPTKNHGPSDHFDQICRVVGLT